jgi:hypothetical protein
MRVTLTLRNRRKRGCQYYRTSAETAATEEAGCGGRMYKTIMGAEERVKVV